MATVSAASSSRSEQKRKNDGERKDVYLGIDDFNKIIEEHLAFIDKTILSKNGWRNLLKSVCFYVQGDSEKVPIYPCYKHSFRLEPNRKISADF